MSLLWSILAMTQPWRLTGALPTAEPGQGDLQAMLWCASAPLFGEPPEPIINDVPRGSTVRVGRWTGGRCA